MPTHLKDVIQQLQDPAALDQIADILAEQMPPPDDAGNIPGAGVPPSPDVFGQSILPAQQGPVVVGNAPPPPQILGEGAARAGADTARLRQEYQSYAISIQMTGGVALPFEEWVKTRGVAVPNTGGG